MDSMIKLVLADKAEVARMQATVTANHYLHRPVDARCSIEAYTVLRHEQPIGLLMFGRPEATRCSNWYGSVDDVAQGRCEVTRWQVLNLARVWFDPIVQPNGYYYRPDMLPGYVDRHGAWRSTLASTVIKLAAQRIGYDYLAKRPPCFLDEPYQIRYLLSYCDRKVHRGVIYRQSGFELYRTNGQQIETWRLSLPSLTVEQDAAICAISDGNERSRRYRAQRIANQLQLSLV